MVLFGALRAVALGLDFLYGLVRELAVVLETGDVEVHRPIGLVGIAPL